MKDCQTCLRGYLTSAPPVPRACTGSKLNAAGARRKHELLPQLADWRRLAVTGTRLGSVAEIGNSFEGSGAHLRFDPTWSEMSSNLDPTCVTAEDRSDVLSIPLVYLRAHLCRGRDGKGQENCHYESCVHDAGTVIPGPGTFRTGRTTSG